MEWTSPGKQAQGHGAGSFLDESLLAGMESFVCTTRLRMTVVLWFLFLFTFYCGGCCCLLLWLGFVDNAMCWMDDAETRNCI
jgi:hypothetical protein